MKYFLLILFLLSNNLIFSQSLVLTDVSVENYPQIDCEYLVLDENNKKLIPNLSELQLFENGYEQNLFNHECFNSKQPEPISVVLTIDNSASMKENFGNPENLSEVVRASAKKFIDILDPQSEIAITYFATSSELVQPLTLDRTLAKAAVDNIPEPIGGTNLPSAFLDENTGSLDALNGAKYRKVIVFLTDGNDANFNDNAIIDEIGADDVRIFTMSIYTSMDKDLKRVAKRTDGIWFDNVFSTQDIEKVYKTLALLTQGIEPCKVSYISENCELERDLEFIYDKTHIDKWRLDLEKNFLVEYVVSPTEIKLHNDGKQESSNIINLISRTDSLIIENINMRYNEFTIQEISPLNFPIRLNNGEKLTFRIKTINSEKSKNDIILIESNSCQDNIIPVYYISSKKDLEVISPNGGEVYFIGSQLPMEWKDKVEDNVYKLEISTNAGINWDIIAENYNAKDYLLDKTPNRPTDEALFKVSTEETTLDDFQTNNLAVINNASGNFEKLVKIDDGKYLAISTFNDYFEYRDLIVDSTSQSNQGNHSIKKILMLLDKNLNPVRHKVIEANINNYKITVSGGNIFLLINIDRYLFYDDKIEISYPLNVTGTGVLVKIDTDLEYVSHKTLQSNSSDAFSETQLIDFVSYEDNLFILGEFGIDFSYDKKVIVDTIAYTKGLYLLNIDSDLNLKKYKFWDKVYDRIDVTIDKMEAKGKDKVYIYGNGSSSSLLNLSYKVNSIFEFEYDLSNDQFKEISSLKLPKSSNYNTIAYLSYKDITYYLLRVNDTLYYNDKSGHLYNQESRVRVVAINNNQELEWDIELDKFGLDKDMAINDSQELIIFGRTTNESFQFDTVSVSRSANTHFMAAIGLFKGQKKWIRYVGSSKYGEEYIVDGEQIISSGVIYKGVDFGNGFTDSVDYESGEFEKPYLWSIGIDRKTNSDLSDSLWSIRPASFRYIDTIDFRKVYWGTRKDTLVNSFIERMLPGPIEIISIKIDNLKFGTDFVGPKDLDEQLDVSFVFNPDQIGDDLARGTITTSQGNYYFYLKGEGVDLRWSFRDSILIDFGNVDITEFAVDDTLIARNEGESEITIDSVLIVGDDNNEFSYNITTNEDRIFSFDSLLSEFRYEPVIAGLSEAEVLYYLAVRSKPIVVLLKGVGIPKDSIRFKVVADSTSSKPNSLNDITLELEISEDPVSLGMEKIEVDISYNATLLLPFRLEDTGIVIDKIRYITLTFNRNDIDNLKLVKKFLPTIGNSISTDINIDSVRVFNGKNEIINQTVIETGDGQFTLQGVCFSDGRYRLYEESLQTDLTVVKENGNYSLNYNLVESGNIKISLFDINGTHISDLVARNIQKGEHETEISTDNISNGNYVLQLETPTEIITKIFTLVK